MEFDSPRKVFRKKFLKVFTKQALYGIIYMYVFTYSRNGYFKC